MFASEGGVICLQLVIFALQCCELLLGGDQLGAQIVSPVAYPGGQGKEKKYEQAKGQINEPKF